jgi:antitoxin component of MazEF toxin-antitoxin module
VTPVVNRLVKTGNNLALILDRPMLERLKIDASTPLEVSTDREVIVITPRRNRRRTSKVRRLVSEAYRQYGGVFRRLAAQ